MGQWKWIVMMLPKIHLPTSQPREPQRVADQLLQLLQVMNALAMTVMPLLPLIQTIRWLHARVRGVMKIYLIVRVSVHSVPTKQALLRSNVKVKTAMVMKMDSLIIVVLEDCVMGR